MRDEILRYIDHVDGLERENKELTQTINQIGEENKRLVEQRDVLRERLQSHRSASSGAEMATIANYVDALTEERQRRIKAEKDREVFLQDYEGASRLLKEAEEKLVIRYDKIIILKEQVKTLEELREREAKQHQADMTALQNKLEEDLKNSASRVEMQSVKELSDRRLQRIHEQSREITTMKQAFDRITCALEEAK